MRNSNKVFEVPLRNFKGVIVHRGVSQGGRKLSPEERTTFWLKNAKKVEGVSLGLYYTRFTLGALSEMHRRNLVLVVNPAKPHVWTPARIKKLGKKFSAVKFTTVNESKKNVRRRGGLQL
jgi:hypothetical protein